MSSKPQRRYYSIADLTAMYPMSRFTIYKWAADPDNDFPAAVELGQRMLAWPVDEVEAWEKRRRTDSGKEDK